MNSRATSAPQTPGESSWPKTDVRYWRTRLLHRKYVGLARPNAEREYFARLEHEGRSSFFALRSADADTASDRALRLYQTVVEQGWAQVEAQSQREFTLAIHWSENPFACTYTTLLTHRNVARTRRARRVSESRPVSVVLLTGDSAVRLALAHWLEQIPGYVCAGAFDRPADAERHWPTATQLVLADRHWPELPPGVTTEFDDASTELIPAFRFGIYETSDDIFVSLTGVAGGYFLRRRAPEEVLDPIAGQWLEGPPRLDRLAERIRSHFQNLFGQPPPADALTDRVHLTTREQEILQRLSRGWQDKQIADTLHLSVWTVHNHMKNIFRKLQVHSRTEAVIKYLQK